MRKILIVFMSVFVSFQSLCQLDSNVNPILISSSIEKVNFKNFVLEFKYYSIEDNLKITNPSVIDYVKFARKTSSYIVFVQKNGKVKFSIELCQRDKGFRDSFYYKIINHKTNGVMELPCSVGGEISEKRVDEMIKNQYDSLSKKGHISGTNKKQFLYNNMIYGYQSYDLVKEEINAISQELMRPKFSSQKEIKNYIIEQSKNGELDFDSILKKEKQDLFLIDGIAYNKNDFAVLLWAKKVKRLGLMDSKKTCKLWEKIYKRKMTKPQKKAFKIGFEE